MEIGTRSRWSERLYPSSYLAKPGQEPLTTSSVRSFKRRSSLANFNESYTCSLKRWPLTLAHTGSAIVCDDAGVVVGLFVGEAFQHPPLLTRFFRL